MPSAKVFLSIGISQKGSTTMTQLQLDELQYKVLTAVNSGLKTHQDRKGLAILEAKFASIAKRNIKLNSQEEELNLLLQNF